LVAFDLSLSMSTIVNRPSVAWCAALTTVERADRWRGRFGTEREITASDALDENEARVAAWRAGQWAMQSPFRDDPSLLASRFADLAVPAEAMPYVLGASPERLAYWRGREEGVESAWLGELTEYLNRAIPHGVRQKTTSAERGSDQLASPLTAPIAFLVHGASSLLMDVVAAMASGYTPLAFVPEDIAAVATRSLVERLTTSASRIVALEIQVARMRGILEGDTPEQRARSFAERFQNPSASVALLSEYPAAARLLAVQTTQWCDATIELLVRLRADTTLLEQQFAAGEKLGTLTDLRTLGDSHRGGRSVMVLTFASGIRIVYKPRSLAVEKAYGGLLDWVNSHGILPPLRRPHVLDCGTHGWTEHITAATCASLNAVTRYYERLGAHLALQYLLDGSDLHRENVIAAGEHPYFIDLETLFHPILEPLHLGSSRTQASVPEQQELLSESVLKTGLLPAWIWTDDEGRSVDLSGIGGVAGQVMPGTLLKLHGADTDSIRFSRERFRLGPAENAPLAGTNVPQDVRAEAIDRGFSAVYGLLMSNASAITPRGLLAPFENVLVRVVIRPTQTYGLVLRESLHPDFLRDGVDRDRFLDKLWVAVRTRPDLIPVIPAERLALQRGEVPVFHTTPRSRDLIFDTW
jgi:type 2 lantibiotic biosynthesis protein LanM